MQIAPFTHPAMTDFAGIMEAARRTMAHSARLRAEFLKIVEHSRAAREQSVALATRPMEPHPFAVLAERRAKRSKLFYKNRWLISRNVVIALRRAGVACDIIVADQARCSLAQDMVCNQLKH